MALLFTLVLTGVIPSCQASTAPAAHLTPVSFNEVRPGGLTADARAVYRGPENGLELVHFTIRLHNPGTEPVALNLLAGGCLVRFIAYTDAALARRPLWNGLTDPGGCFDIGEVVVVPPADSAEISHAAFTRSVVTEALARGPVFALAIIQESLAPNPYGIDAGQITALAPP